MSLVIYCVLLRVGLQTRASFRFLTVFYLVKHRYRLHLSFAHKERHQLISCFVTKLERKIIENQLHTSNRNIKRMVLLPIVRISSHIAFLINVIYFLKFVTYLLLSTQDWSSSNCGAFFMWLHERPYVFN